MATNQRDSSRIEIFWRRFQDRQVNLIGLYFLIFLVVTSFANLLFRPDKTQFANEQHLELAKLKPLSKVQYLKIRKNEVNNEDAASEFRRVPLSSIEIQEKAVRLKIRNTNGIEEYRHFSLLDVFYPLRSDVITKADLWKGDTFQFEDMTGSVHSIRFTELRDRLKNEAIITRRYLLGTDQYGRDLLSRLLAGSGISLGVGFLSVFSALIFGISIGMISGYFGGSVDRILNWIMNVIYSLPAILLVFGITVIIGTGVFAVIVGISLVLWVEMARIIRGEVISIRNKEYINAARLIGVSDTRILLKHVLPNLTGPIIILSAGNFADAILLEAGLSFLGIGIQPPKPSWGGMIRELYGYIITDGAYMAIVPGLAIVLMVMAFLIVSQGLKEALESNIGSVKPS